MDQSQRLIADGNQALENKRYESAIALYEQALALRTGNDAVARGNIQIVRRHQGSDAIRRGNALYDQRQFGRAIEEYRVALTFVPNDAVALKNLALANAAIASESLADAKYRQDQERSAMDQIVKATARAKADAYYEWAKEAHVRREYDEAIRLVELANVASPDPLYERVLTAIRAEKLTTGAEKLRDAARAAYARKDYFQAKELDQQAVTINLFGNSEAAEQAKRKHTLQRETLAIAEQPMPQDKPLGLKPVSGRPDVNLNGQQDATAFGQSGNVSTRDAGLTPLQSGRPGTITDAGRQAHTASISLDTAARVFDGGGATATNALPRINIQGVPAECRAPINLTKLLGPVLEDPDFKNHYRHQIESLNEYAKNASELKKLNEGLKPGTEPDLLTLSKKKTYEQKMETAMKNADRFGEMAKDVAKRRFGIKVEEEKPTDSVIMPTEKKL